ncbi:MAG: hypothetical protein QXS54_12260 [Candidatus Methanomethylicaceae archaeon]
MTTYRVPEFTLEQRTAVAAQMLVAWPERQWGLESVAEFVEQELDGEICR